MIRTREIRITKAEDAFMHLLMLNHPWRSDVDSWIGIGKDHETYQSLALEVLGRNRIEELAEDLLVVLDYGNVYENPAIEPDAKLPIDIEWTKDQMNVLDMVRCRLQSREDCLILVTGAAGTGKSTVLEEIHRIAKNERFEPIRLAPSGVAAVNIKGQTLHRWFRLTKLGRQFPEGNSFEVRMQLMDIADQGLRPIFLIDEVSMISGAILSVLSKTLQEAAKVDSGVPFGGFPVILFGDFGQLGPVNKTLASPDWIWNSEVYQSFERVDLIQPCRQSGDVDFKSMLDDIRRGEVTSTMASLFFEICNQSETIPEDAIHLYPKKKEVQELNLQKLESLPGSDWYSIASDNARITMDSSKREAIEAETGLISILRLKVGARVMCTSNVDVAGRIVNGTTGEVVQFYGQHVVQVKEDNTGRIFNIQKECRRTKFNGQERRQFPLILAWGLTIHKSQSLTLNKVVVNLYDVFASGQAYVAMSRVRTRNDLFIKNWSARGLLSVKHSTKSRLTKLSEASRTPEDEEIEKLEQYPESQSEIEVAENRGLNEMQLQGWEGILNSVLSHQVEQGYYFHDAPEENAPSPSLPLPPSPLGSNRESNEDPSMIDDERLEEWMIRDNAQLDDVGNDIVSEEDVRLKGLDVGSSAKFAEARNEVISADKLEPTPKIGTFREDMFNFRSKKRIYSDSDSSEPNVAVNNARVKKSKKRQPVPSKKRARRGSSAVATDSDKDDVGNQIALGSVTVKRRAALEVADTMPRKKPKRLPEQE
jgi:energy-coupling factor transporter ATP-binding protein EcfA2